MKTETESSSETLFYYFVIQTMDKVHGNSFTHYKAPSSEASRLQVFSSIASFYSVIVQFIFHLQTPPALPVSHFPPQNINSQIQRHSKQGVARCFSAQSKFHDLLPPPFSPVPPAIIVTSSRVCQKLTWLHLLSILPEPDESSQHTLSPCFLKSTFRHHLPG
jgi:hypothetical protein